MSVRLTVLIFDGITAFLLAVIPLYFVELRQRARGLKLPSPELHYLAAALLAAVWLVVFYGSFIEPRLLTVGRYDVGLGSAGGRLKVAVVGDTHLGVYQGRDWLQRVVDRTNAEQPDLVLLGGDYVVNMPALDDLEPLKNLKAKYGVYAVLGNFDYRVGAVDVRERLGSYGVKTLVNRSVPLDLAGRPLDAAQGLRRLRLIGLDDYWYGDPDWTKALAGVEPNAVKIVLAHNPDLAPKGEASGVDLMIAAHTHGGQVRLPFIGPLTKLPIAIGQRFDKGLFDFGPMKLFITPGVGESGVRARLFDPPEISILNLSF